MVETAGKAAQRVAWASNIVLSYQPKLADDVALMQPIQTAVKIAKESAEQGWLTCRQALMAHTGRHTPAFAVPALPMEKPVKWSAKAIAGVGSLPEVTFLNLSRTETWQSSMSSLRASGYDAEGAAIMFDKECDIFSEAHHILEGFCGVQLVKFIMTFDYDFECTLYPEVYEAWKMAGGDDCSMSVAKYKAVKKWGVGFGGKKTADRAAKLALAVAMASTVTTVKIAEVSAHFPKFASLLQGGST